MPLRKRLAEIDPEIVLADGFEDALIGVAERCNQRPVAVYDREKCIRILIERDGMPWTVAEEFFDFNVASAWVGDRTPLFLRRPVGCNGR